MNHDNYNTLLQALKETHEEENRLTLSNNRLKGLNNWWRNKINSLQEELQYVKIDFEHLKMIYKVASYIEVVSCKPTKFENCKVLKDKIKYLIKIIARLTLGTENINDNSLNEKTTFSVKLALVISLVFRKRKRSLAIFLITTKGKIHRLLY